MTALRNLANVALGQIKSNAKILSIFLVASLFVGVITAKHFRELPTESPVEARFAALGRANAPRNLAADALAYERAADAIHAGKPLIDTVAAIPKAQSDLRADTGKRWLLPDLEKVMPAGKPETQITAAERTDIEAAFRGYARGLRGKYP